MIIVQKHCGRIRYSKAFLYTLVSETVTSCFGVAALNAANRAEEVISRIPFVKNSRNAGKGITVEADKGKLVISLHISVVYGSNAAALMSSIQHKLSFTIEEQTGLRVEKVNIFIDDLVN